MLQSGNPGVHSRFDAWDGSDRPLSDFFTVDFANAGAAPGSTGRILLLGSPLKMLIFFYPFPLTWR